MYRLCVSNSVEERLFKLQEEKKSLSRKAIDRSDAEVSKVVEGSNSNDSNKLTLNDLKAFFT